VEDAFIDLPVLGPVVPTAVVPPQPAITVREYWTPLCVAPLDACLRDPGERTMVPWARRAWHTFDTPTGRNVLKLMAPFKAR